MDRTLPEHCYNYIKSQNEIVLIKRGDPGYHTTVFECVKDEEINEDVVRELNAKLGVSALEKTCMIIGSMFGWDVPGAYKSKYAPEEKKRIEDYEHRWEQYLSSYVKNDLEATGYDFEYIKITTENSHLNPEDMVYLGIVTKADAEKIWNDKRPFPEPSNRGEGYWKKRLQEYVMNDYKSSSPEYIDEAMKQAGMPASDRRRMAPENPPKQEKIKSRKRLRT